MCKNFDHTTKWYMHQPESIQENVIHKILMNFDWFGFVYFGFMAYQPWWII